MSDLDGLINSKISLISQDDVKFDGTLYSINAEESSMILKDVKCMGTEDRVTDPKKQIAASPTVIPFVTFPGQEIKDLIVHEVEIPVVVAKDPVPVPVPPPRKQAVVPPKQPVPVTQPAPIVQPVAQQPQQQPPQQQSPQQQQQPPQRQPKVNSRPPPQQQQQKESSSTISEQTTAPPVQSKVNPPVPPTHHTATATASYGHSQPRDGRASSSSGAGTGAHLLRLKERKERGAENTTTTTERSGSGSGEFDFNAGLSMFKKDDVFAVVATEAEVSSSSEVKYKKDDFFDSLSCDLTDRKEGRNTRMSAAEERVLNQDTFGAIALQSTGNYRRNYRGGGGGYAGRGGGRGRGRGGRGGRSYQNQYQATN